MNHGLFPDEGDGTGVVATDEGIDVVSDLSNIGAAAG
jgi:hypothetical protein